ncbi:integrase core domain-containing protein [Rhodococcus qingshengii]|uniref:integrase core domain-containing protein n=1 Tax=Rhodococcus qingshengii TaxID=334542 RepID=UPI001AE0AA38
MTLKYLHDFPKSFASLTDAREFLEGFFNEYNHIHHHSGIGWHTPASVHFGTASAIDEARQITLTAAFHANPARFSNRPAPPKIPKVIYINEPALEFQNT